MNSIFPKEEFLFDNIGKHKEKKNGQMTEHDGAYETLAKKGYADNAILINALGSNGKQANSENKPTKFEKSPSNEAINSAQGVQGVHVFGVSIKDGYHSLVLVMDARSSTDDPLFYLYDQHRTSSGGTPRGEPWNAAQLDEYLLKMNSSWYDANKSNANVRLFKIKRNDDTEKK